MKKEFTFYDTLVATAKKSKLKGLQQGDFYTVHALSDCPECPTINVGFGQPTEQVLYTCDCGASIPTFGMVHYSPALFVHEEDLFAEIDRCYRAGKLKRAQKLMQTWKAKEAVDKLLDGID